jgi:hypothetical protein
MALNGSDMGDIVINATNVNSARGTFNFTDTKVREFRMEYVHGAGPSFMKLSWDSPSTPRQVIPDSAFTHWRNASHFNTTIHPAVLSPIHSTAAGEALHEAVAGMRKSFVVYARDEFSNLLEKGGDVPTMVAVGPDGVAFRGEVTDYGNSTYLINYMPTVTGTFRMYVTIGCCAPHPNVGFPREVQLMQMHALLIMGAPFTLDVAPGELVQTRTVTTGAGLVSSVAGEPSALTIHYRDVHDNPTAAADPAVMPIHAFFTDVQTGLNVSLEAPHGPMEVVVTRQDMSTGVTYTMTRAGTWHLHLMLGGKHILGSPYTTVVHPTVAAPAQVVCTGAGLRQGSTKNHFPFRVQLRDAYSNNLRVGGAKLFVRLRGDSFHRGGAMSTIPSCDDNGAGVLSCAHKAVANGSHQLDIRLLNYDMDQTGGMGLTGRYYLSADMFRPGATDAGADAETTVTQIEPVLAFQWPSGRIVPGMERLTAQSLRLDGFLVAPKTDIFSFRSVARHVDVTIFIDDELVFDAVLGLSTAVPLLRGSAYLFRIEARSELAEAHEASLEVLWSSPTLRESRIPKYFLHDKATSIAFSPFAVDVA